MSRKTPVLKTKEGKRWPLLGNNREETVDEVSILMSTEVVIADTNTSFPHLNTQQL
jgi:hypothetical protein